MTRRIITIVLATVSTCLCGEDLKTWVAAFKDKSGCELKVKCITPADQVMRSLQDLNTTGFILESYSSVDDGGGYDKDRYTYRYTILCIGIRKNGSKFTEESGGFATSLKEAVAKARSNYEKLEKEVASEGSLELRQIAVYHETFIPRSDSENSRRNNPPRNKDQPQPEQAADRKAHEAPHPLH